MADDDNDINNDISDWLESGSGQNTMMVLVVIGGIGMLIYFIMAAFS